MTYDVRSDINHLLERVTAECCVNAANRAVMQYEALERELGLYAGPVCPIDGRRAAEHVGLQDYFTLRSFAEPTPVVPHEFEECWDCDAMSDYHRNEIRHCAHCHETRPEFCDKTITVGGQRPPHPEWPEAEMWWKRRNLHLIRVWKDSR